MRFGFVKAVAATPVVRVADCTHNAGAILDVFCRAERDGAKLLVLPELCVTGYTCGDLFLQLALQRAALTALETVARRTERSDMLVVLGLPLSVGCALYNCAVVLHRGKALGVVPKSVLPNYGEFYEKRIFVPAPDTTGAVRLLGSDVPFGSGLLFACGTLPEFVLGVEICEDLWAPQPPSTLLASAGATVIANLSASDEAVTKAEYRRMIVRSQSARQSCAYVFACAGEGESTTDLVFAGHDMIYENGVLLAESAPFAGGYAAADVDVQYVARERQRLTRGTNADGSFTRVPFDFEISETNLTRAYWKTPFVPDTEPERGARCEEILELQARGLAARIRHTNVKSAVVGVSGGADSALALLVADRAFSLLGRDKRGILAVTMPCFGTSTRTRGNAGALCELLGIACRTVDITAAVSQHLRDIGHAPDVADVAFENAQARERTQVLMDIANMENGMVVGTGDLSELALGFATYNGDHMSMYAVNSGVPKTMVRAMLTHFAHSFGGGLSRVLLDIVATPVSPELLPAKDGQSAQITEDLVGPYELTDFFLYHMIRRGEPREKILRLASRAFCGEYAPETIKTWLDSFYKRFFAQQFKRSCMPDGPRVGSVSLSPRGDWRMPSDAVPTAFLE